MQEWRQCSQDDKCFDVGSIVVQGYQRYSRDWQECRTSAGDGSSQDLHGRGSGEDALYVPAISFARLYDADMLPGLLRMEYYELCCKLRASKSWEDACTETQSK